MGENRLMADLYAENERLKARISELESKHFVDCTQIAQLKDFESIKEAVKETGLNQSGITSCCCGRYKQTGGYVFRYKYSCYKKTKQLIGNIYDNPELIGSGAE